MTQFEIFKHLHQPGNPFVLGNAWDVTSARLLEKNGFKAIATSSLAVANTLGYEDGEQISFDELFFIVRRIKQSISVPLSVDIERGLSGTQDGIIENIEKLIEIGVVGINIEDSGGKKGNQSLDTVESFCEKIAGIKHYLAGKNLDIFINARTDAFLLNIPQALETSLLRAKAYAEAGADGIFVPFIKDQEEIKRITAISPTPINVLSIAGLPTFDELSSCGAGRISLGSTLFRASYRQVETLIQKINAEKSVRSLF